MPTLSDTLRSRGIKREVLENCPVLGRISVREIEADKFIALSEKQRDKTFTERMRLIAVACVEDPDTNELALTEADIPYMHNWAMLTAINDACNRCCGIEGTAKDAEKNLSAAPGGDSSSSSVESSGELSGNSSKALEDSALPI